MQDAVYRILDTGIQDDMGMQDGRCHGDAGCKDRPYPSQPGGPSKEGPADMFMWVLGLGSAYIASWYLL